jgi:hypothetical protein
MPLQKGPLHGPTNAYTSTYHRMRNFDNGKIWQNLPKLLPFNSDDLYFGNLQSWLKYNVTSSAMVMCVWCCKASSAHGYCTTESMEIYGSSRLHSTAHTWRL